MRAGSPQSPWGPGAPPARSAPPAESPGGEAGLLTGSENQGWSTKRSPIHYRVILAWTGPARPHTLRGCLRRGWDLPWGCSVGSRPRGDHRGLLKLPPQTVASWAGEGASNALTPSVYLQPWGFPEPRFLPLAWGWGVGGGAFWG